MLIAILGVTAIVTMPVDIFPYIDIPVVSVVWTYGGLSPEEMEKRMVTIFERAMTTTVNDIEHIESQSYSGVSVTRVYFQPNAKVEMALSQVTAIAQTLLRIFPPGTTPPSIIKYDASSVPILQLGLESKTLSEQELYDLGQNFIRTQLATIQGAAVPPALRRQIPHRHGRPQSRPALCQGPLADRCLERRSATQNLILPAGTAKIGDKDYQVKVNSSPRVLDEMNDLPVKVVNGATVYMQRRRPGARRLFRADQHRAHQRHPRRAAHRAAQRQGLHAGRGEQRQEGAARNPRRPAAGPRGPPVVRSVAVRARGHQRRGARSRHRRLPHRPDDPAVPGKLAQHGDRLHLHPAFHPGLAHRAEPAWARPST